LFIRPNDSKRKTYILHTAVFTSLIAGLQTATQNTQNSKSIEMMETRDVLFDLKKLFCVCVEL